MMDELTYRMEDGYRIPNLEPPEEPEGLILGRYAALRREYLMKHNRIMFINLLTTGKLNIHLADIEEIASNRKEILIKQMEIEQGVTEKLKAEDQMKWVGIVSNIQCAAHEIILNELIYS